MSQVAAGAPRIAATIPPRRHGQMELKNQRSEGGRAMSKSPRRPRTLPPNFVATYAALIPFVTLFFPELLSLAGEPDAPRSSRQGDDAAEPRDLTSAPPPDSPARDA